MEQFPFIDKNCHYTSTFKEYIIKEWRYQSLKELSRKFHVSSTLIYQSLSTISIESLIEANIEFLMNLIEIHIWVDEVSFKWHDYFLHITELQTKKTVAVLKTNSKKVLQEWLWKLPKEVISKIKYIASDMNATYKSTIQKHIRDTLSGEIILWQVWDDVWEWVADMFHIKQLFNNLIAEVYSLNSWMMKQWYYDKKQNDLTKKKIQEENKYRTSPLWSTKKEYSPDVDSKEYIPITTWNFMTKKYHNLLWLSSEKLTLKQAHRLNQILIEFDPKWYMKEAYLWKEMMNEIIEKKDIGLLEKLIDDLMSSTHYKIAPLWKTLKKWYNEIVNYLKTGITNALTEWKNTQIKLFRKMAFWYKIKENYMKRIMLAL